jgi:hypothetical protein
MYNEKKVARGVAEFLHARNYLQNDKDLTIAEKLDRINQRNDLNTRAETKTYHIFISFHASEKSLTNATMQKIADRYMTGVGLADYPHLVYRHYDTHTPHLHIVTSLIGPDGRRFNTDDFAILHSNPTRLAIEKEFNLVPAQAKNRTQQQEQKSTETRRFAGGRDATITQIDKVVSAVMRDYKYGSLPEFNAILRGHNVLVETGGPNSKTHKYNGAYYIGTDDQGRKITPPIKASQLPSRPMLSTLKAHFAPNIEARKQDLPTLRNKVNEALDNNPGSLRILVDDLHRQGVDLVTYQRGRQVYGLTYVDHTTRIAANGEDLGKPYTAANILKALGPGADLSLGPNGRDQRPNQQPAQQKSYQDNKPNPEKEPQLYIPQGFNARAPQLLAGILQSDPSGGSGPGEFGQDQETRKKHRR